MSLFVALSALALGSCDSRERPSQADLDEMRVELSKGYSEWRKAEGLPPISPNTKAEWQEACEQPEGASSFVQAGCESIEATGYPFPSHQADAHCLYEDPGYSNPEKHQPYFDRTRQTLKRLWGSYDPDLSVQEVCAAYKEAL